MEKDAGARKTSARHSLPSNWDEIVPWIDSQDDLTPSQKIEFITVLQPFIQGYVEREGRVKVLEQEILHRNKDVAEGKKLLRMLDHFFQSKLMEARANTKGLERRLTETEQTAIRRLIEIQEAARKIELAESRAEYDPATKLLWRPGFKKRLIELYSTIEQPNISAIVVADINRFKSINDTFGHAMGDLVIRRAGASLRASTRSRKGPRRDMKARLGGDEFGLSLAGIDGPDSSRELSERKAKALGVLKEVMTRCSHSFVSVDWKKEYKQYWKGELERPPSFSIGVVVIVHTPDLRVTPETRAEHAERMIDAALHVADKELMYESKGYERDHGKVRVFLKWAEFLNGRFIINDKEETFDPEP